ncbi:MAG: YraN family protein [Defluviitaleaceae bacterium]|nr:YraN family protein [Defluviitaleaceae bacterium]
MGRFFGKINEGGADMNLDRRKQAGNFAETAATRYLAAKGYQILVQNYKVHGGEIDIIAKDSDYIVFIEVKYRKQLDYGRPAEAITVKKQRTMIKAARTYLAKEGFYEANCRFDIIEVFGREHLDVNHIENAFWES